MIEPEKNISAYKKYFSEALGVDVRIRQAQALEKSTRNAPWRFDLEVKCKISSYVLRMDARSSILEYQILKAMEGVPIPTPKVYGLDEAGENFGEPCFFMDLIEGQSLLLPLLAGEAWAEDLYIATADQLQSISFEDLGGAAGLLETESAEDVLDSAYEYLHTLKDPVAEQAYQRLKTTVPKTPKLCFSNGDLYPDNMLVKGKTLVGVIDFANASISDPLFEFLLPFFCHPELRGRGIEERFCEVKGINPDVLPWYHGLEFFDTWRWVSKYEEPFVGYDEARLKAALEAWLAAD